MKNDRELLELIVTQIGSLTDKVDKIESELDVIKSTVTKTDITIEHDIRPKIGALFDGYKQNSEQLTRIENEVSKHEEIIMRRIR